jgi:hypothetical protein
MRPVCAPSQPVKRTQRSVKYFCMLCEILIAKESK